MPADTPTSRTRSVGKAPAARVSAAPVGNGGHGGYEVPWVHLRLPESLVDGGFWAALAGAALVGSVDPPLAALIGTGVIVARHHKSS